MVRCCYDKLFQPLNTIACCTVLITVLFYGMEIFNMFNNKRRLEIFEVPIEANHRNIGTVTIVGRWFIGKNASFWRVQLNDGKMIDTEPFLITFKKKI